jgi:hypothetical protein
LLDTLKNAILDLLDDRSLTRYASNPRVRASRTEIPTELFAELGYVPVARGRNLPRELTRSTASGGWTAN